MNTGEVLAVGPQFGWIQVDGGTRLLFNPREGEPVVEGDQVEFSIAASHAVAPGASVLVRRAVGVKKIVPKAAKK